MRLLKRLAGVEASGAASAREVRGRVGLVYSAGDQRVSAAQLKAGEMIACDMHYLRDPIAGDMPTVRMVERVTSDANDLGWVFDAAGLRVGRVTRLDGSLICYSLRAASVAG